MSVPRVTLLLGVVLGVLASLVLDAQSPYAVQLWDRGGNVLLEVEPLNFDGRDLDDVISVRFPQRLQDDVRVCTEDGCVRLDWLRLEIRVTP